MSILQQVSDKMQTILRRLADQAAVETGMVKRNRKLTGSALTQILVFGWLENPGASYHELAETASVLGIDVSRQAIAQRLRRETAEMLKATLDAAITETLELTAAPQVLPLLESFNGIFVQDSTWLSLPDALHETWQGPRKKDYPKKAALKLHLRFDVLTGRFTDFHLTDGLVADSTAAKQFQTLAAGSLHLADLGYFSLDELHSLTENGIYWITRLKAGCHLFQETGEPLCLEKWLNRHPENTVIRKRIRVGKTKQLDAYLIAERLSEEETNKRRRYIKHRAKRKHENPSKIRLRLAAWNLYITNIEEHRLTPKQIRSIARIRWQVELMFKDTMKSVGKLSHSRYEKPYRILAEVYAKLIAALLRHAVMLGAGWRCIRHSLIKTSRLITSYGRMLMLSFRKSTAAVIETLKDIKRIFENGSYLQEGTGKYTTLRRLYDALENP